MAAPVLLVDLGQLGKYLAAQTLPGQVGWSWMELYVAGDSGMLLGEAMSRPLLAFRQVFLAGSCERKEASGGYV
jgi:hypothetical protein